MTAQIHKMMTRELKKIAFELLDAYGSSHFIWQHGRKNCQLVFSEGIYWHYIWIIDPSSSNPWQNRQMLDGNSVQEIVEKIFLVFKRSCWLESTMYNGKITVVKLGDGTGKPEEFMIKYELLYTAASIEEAKNTLRAC